MSIQILSELPGAHASKVELVEIEGKKYVLKTASVDDIANEHAFFAKLKELQLPSLAVAAHERILSHQMLLEYVEGSPTLGSLMSAPLCFAWGQLMKKIHSARSPEPMVMKDGRLSPVSWSHFIRSEIDQSKEKPSDVTENLPQQKIAALLRDLRMHAPQQYSLLHADAHSNNILVKNGELYAFDKGSEIFYGDPLYDLALIAIEFPNGLYTTTEHTDHLQDQTYLQAFVQGYGFDFMKEDQYSFDLYVLLRACSRYPNKFEPYLFDTILSIVNKYSEEQGK